MSDWLLHGCYTAATRHHRGGRLLTERAQKGGSPLVGKSGVLRVGGKGRDDVTRDDVTRDDVTSAVSVACLRVRI